MDLFIVILAIAFVQVWGAENPLHKDQWMSGWIEYLEKYTTSISPTMLALAVGAPLLAVAVLLELVSYTSSWLILPVGVVVLLYSFGRGEFGEIVTEYTKACYVEDWPSALERASRLNVSTDDLEENDWPTLHQHVLDEAAYRGFERMFAVLFWFFVLGPAGALLYRLTFLFQVRLDVPNTYAQKLLWLMEWPAVRVLGLSFALTGNFMGCYHHWRESVLCVKRPTMKTLCQSVLGALSVDDGIMQTCDVTRRELTLLELLYRRTLWFWLATAAIFIIIV